MNIIIKNLNKSYGSEKIFENFNLELTDSKVNCIIGQSGCGKSTLLNILSNLISIDSGEILGMKKGDISYIFQEDRLIEWLTIEENLKLALKSYFTNDTLNKKIDSMLSMLDIMHVKFKYPNELSGGMRQRVNIARAFGKTSNVILMDEPFKSLDYKLKYSIIDKFKEILLEEKRMVILVTHDVDEAIYFQGNIIVFGNRPVEVKKIFTDALEERKYEILKLI